MASAQGEVPNEVVEQFHQLVSQLTDKRASTRSSAVGSMNKLLASNHQLIHMNLQTIVDSVLRAMNLGANVSVGCELLGLLAREDPESNVMKSLTQDLYNLLKKQSKQDDTASLVMALGWCGCMVGNFNSMFSDLSSTVLQSVSSLFTPALLSRSQEEQVAMLQGLSVCVLGVENEEVCGWVWDRLAPVLFFYVCQAELPVVKDTLVLLSYMINIKKAQEDGVLDVSYLDTCSAAAEATEDDDYYFLSEVDDVCDVDLPNLRISLPVLNTFVETLLAGAYPWTRESDQGDTETEIETLLDCIQGKPTPLALQHDTLSDVGCVLASVCGGDFVTSLSAANDYIALLCLRDIQDRFEDTQINFRSKDPASMRLRRSKQKTIDVAKHSERRVKHAYVFDD